MKASEVKCQRCGRDAMEASERGAYLARVSPKGQAPVMECAPSCFKTGDQEDAVLRALGGSHADE